MTDRTIDARAEVTYARVRFLGRFRVSGGPRADARGAWRLLAVAIALVLAGGFIAWRTQTAGGTVSVRDVRWVAPDGARMSGLLYVPRTATPKTPAPGIVAIHGYINSRETQSAFAIELARRGYVVLAVDQRGHGYSDPPAFAAGFGGPAALAYLRTLDFVDRDRIGLEGHSMGGWAVGAAAAAMPDAYRSIVLVGSSTGTFGVPPGTPEWPRNLAVIFARWDEFSSLMWRTPRAADVGASDAMRTLFATGEAVEPGRVYGSIEAGTARIFHQPRTTHAGTHHFPEAIAQTVDWFGRTLRGGRTELAPSDQIWMWKELGTLLGAVGMVLLLFPVAALLLRLPFFADLAGAPAPPGAARRVEWWAGAVITALLGPLTLFPFKDLPGAVGWSTSRLFPQSITNGVVAWTTALGLITLALLGARHLLLRRRGGLPPGAYGLTWGGRLDAGRILRSFLLAALVVASGYMALLASDFLFGTDFRFWVFTIKPMSPTHLRIALAYVVPFAFYFLTLATALHAGIRRDHARAGWEYAANVLVLVAGYLVLFAYQYVPFLAGGTLAIPDEPLWTIIAYQLVPIMTIVALVLTWFGRNTGTVYAGAFASALLVTWIVVASQAIHVAP